MLITVQEVNAWLEKTKVALTALDSELVGSIAEQVIAAVSDMVDPTSWLDPTTTPSLIRKIIAMQYAGWYYQRTYSEDEETNSYGLLLLGQAERLITGIREGSLTIAGSVPADGAAFNTQPSFYPTDFSSMQSPTSTDPSLGGPKFTMGTIW